MPRTKKTETPTVTTLSEQEFFETYKPVMYRGALRYYCPSRKQDAAAIQKAHAERRLWTYHHGDYNTTYFQNGWHMVNRLDLVICRKPYAEGEAFITEDPDHELEYECEWCGELYTGISEARYEELEAGSRCSKACPGEYDDEEGD